MVTSDPVCLHPKTLRLYLLPMNDDVKITVMVPGLNEANCIRQTLSETANALRNTGQTYEILAFNDGSTDETGKMMDEFAAQDPCVKVIHHARPLGLGQDYWEAIQLARGEYLGLIPGDAEITPGSMQVIFSSAGQTDVVSAYAINPVIRGFKRRTVSRLYVWLINTFFGYRLRYYNGPCLVRTHLLRKLSKPTTSFAYMTEILVQLLDQGATIKEVEMSLRPRPSGKTKAFRLKNVIGVVSTILGMYWKLRFNRKLTAPV